MGVGPTSRACCSPSGVDAEMGRNRKMQHGVTPALPWGFSRPPPAAPRTPAAVHTPALHMRARAPPAAQREEAPSQQAGEVTWEGPPPRTDSHVGLGTLASQRNTVTFSQEIL